MYKVFVNEKLIYFANKRETLNGISNCLIISFFQTELTAFLLELLKNDAKIDSIIIRVDNPKEAFNVFKEHFKLIIAAGGVVKNMEDNYLTIYRLDKWDLPKGKIEKGESIEEGAIREVEEECGITNINIVEQLSDTFHIYEHKERLILKQTHWFMMETKHDGELVPQTEENITKACWMNDSEIKDKFLTNTYFSIKELLTCSL